MNTLSQTMSVLQAIFGGQPLLIVGVAEPIVLLYKFLYSYAQKRPELGGELFLPWCAWVCTWAAIMLWLTAISGACRYIYKFTRFSGELFGMLIATLFLQQAVEGLKEGFQPDTGVDAVTYGPLCCMHFELLPNMAASCTITMIAVSLCCLCFQTEVPYCGMVNMQCIVPRPGDLERGLHWACDNLVYALLSRAMQEYGHIRL